MIRSSRIRLPAAVAIIIAVLVLVLALALAGAGNDRLSISQTTDGDITTVTITAPGMLVERAEPFQRKRAGLCIDTRMGGEIGFVIDWGDDDVYATKVPVKPGTDGCPDPLSHIYTVPGTYTIRATVGHLSQGDAFIRDWAAQTEVTIEGPLRAADISLLAPATGATFYYQPYVGVAWDLSTDAPADLTLDVIGENGVVFGSRTFKRLSYVGRGEAPVQVGNSAYVELMRRDEVALARVRATLSREGKTQLSRDGAPFTLTAEFVSSHPPRTEVMPGRPLDVTLFHYTYHVDCYDYVIDWGDGTVPQRPEVSPSPTCRGDAAWIGTTHIYAQPGTYDIKIRSNNLDKRTPPKAKPFYEQARVVVP